MTGINHNNLLILLANQTTEALIILDSDHTIQLFNQSAEAVFKYPSIKAVGLPFKEFCNKNHVSCILNTPNIKPATKMDSNKIFTLTHETKFQWTLQEIMDGRHNFYLIKTEGLHQQKIENRIHRLETLIENMPCNVYWVGSDCKMRGCNQNVLNRLNITREEFKNKTYGDLAKLCHLPEGLSNKLKNNDLSVIRSGIPIFGAEDPLYPNADGTYSNFLTSRVPLRNKDGKIVGVAGISVDITLLTETRARAEAANQAKTNFIANMSHDIRTPLTGVIGMSELLENTLQNPSEKENAHMLHESGEELLSMLNDILDDVRADHIRDADINNEVFDLYHCIQDLIKLERPTTIIKGLKLEERIDPRVPRHIISDRKKIHRILLNLLGNAIKFTKSGKVVIQVECLNIKKSKVHLKFSVSDTGIGIPKEMQDKVFDRFFRGTPSYEGMYAGHGLGLHIAQSYVSLLGGLFTLTSEEGVGTTFHFDVPCNIADDKELKSFSNTPLIESEPLISKHESPPVAHEAPLLHLPPIAHNAPHILLVEDNAIARKVMESILSSVGCRFTSSSDGEKALELAKKGNFDLIVTDIGLPGMSGNKLSCLIREFEKDKSKPPIPIIGLTGHARETAITECLAAGMNDVFSKPASLLMIKKIIDKFVLSSIKKLTKTTLQNNTIHDGAEKLGVTLSNKEKALLPLDSFPVLDPKYGLQQTNNLSLLFEVLEDFISDEMQGDIHQMKKAYDQKNWIEVERLAHKIKGSASYGTRRMYYACQYFEKHYRAGHHTLLNKLYYQILDVNRKTVAYLKKWLKKYTPKY